MDIRDKIIEIIYELITINNIKLAKDITLASDDLLEKDIRYYSIRSAILIKEMKLENAMSIIEEGLELEPGNCDLLFNLGYIYELIEDYSNSIKFYKEALNNTNSDELASEIKTIINLLEKKLLISKSNIHNIKGNSLYRNSMKQIAFIVGTGRCGTTILAKILNAHSKICVPPELQFITSIGNGERFYDKYLKKEIKHYQAEDYINLFEQCCPYNLTGYFDIRDHFNNLSYPQIDIKNVFIDLFDNLCHQFNKEVLVKQTPWYGQKLDVLKRLFPNMKVIHIVRDGRDVAISFARTPWWSNDVCTNLNQWEKEVSQIHDFGTKNPSNYLEIRYEDLVTQPKEELIKVLNLLNLSFEENMLNLENLIDYQVMYKHGNPLNHSSKQFKSWSENNLNKKQVLFKDSVYAWGNNKNYDFSHLSSHVNLALQKFGYKI